MRRSSLQFATWLLPAALVFLFSTGNASACTVCYNPEAGVQINSALNGMIFVMLGFVGVIWAGLGFFIYYLIRRAKAPIPDHVLLAESITDEEL